MANVIKVDMKNAYFINKLTNQRQQNYEKNENLILVAKLSDGTVLSIENNCIKTIFNGQQVFEYDSDTKYIIDDGYQNILIRCGYIILNDHDITKIEDRYVGIDIRKEISEDIKAALKDMLEDLSIDTSIDYNRESTELQFHYCGYLYSISIDTINRIVNKNQQRKINNLVYYPFNKEMDKYGTMYLSIFCQKVLGQKQQDDFNRYDFAEEIITKLIDKMNKLSTVDNQYHFYRFIIKRRINYYKEM